VVQAGQLEESQGLSPPVPWLSLATACGSRDVLHTGAACFLVVATVVVDHGRNPLRTLLAPLVATLGALLGILDSDEGRRLLAAAQGCLPATWGRMKFGRLIASGVLGGNATRHLGGAPKNVIRCLEGW
jgi:hypothetical protein